MALPCIFKGQAKGDFSQEAVWGMQRSAWEQTIRDVMGQIFLLVTIGTLLVWVPAGPLLKSVLVERGPEIKSRVGELSNRQRISHEETVFSLSEELLRLEAIRGNLDPV